MNTNAGKIELSLADNDDRQKIYAIRHEVYATELGQHPENEKRQLTDKLDEVNNYIVAKQLGIIVGFVSVTPLNRLGYSIDKYFSRTDLPLVFDKRLYEVRLLTVIGRMRGSHIGAMLYLGALAYVMSKGGDTLVAIGRLEVLNVYLQVGMKSLGLQVPSGKVTYELLTAKTSDLYNVVRLQKVFAYLQKRMCWNLPEINLPKIELCYHGGDFFDAIGDEFEFLQNKERVINADVLDAWFEPAPKVIEVVGKNLCWSLKTSPPVSSDGMRRMLAKARGVNVENILPGAGSSDLIFLGLRHWINKKSKVLILDPMYGEYAHILEKLIGCEVHRLSLKRESDFALEPIDLAHCLKENYDWVILVNPNSPTGQYTDGKLLEKVITEAPRNTHFWIDETYLDFVDSEKTLETFASINGNVIVCKSMSKAYALSGVRCAYLCGSAHMIAQLQTISPPWAVSLPGQMAACEALRNIEYYRECWEETNKLRNELSSGLIELGWDVIEGCANFLLCQLPENQPDANVLISACKKHNLYLRDVCNMGKCFDKRSLRIAVKDHATNLLMIQILKTTLSELLNTD